MVDSENPQKMDEAVRRKYYIINKLKNRRIIKTFEK